MRIIIATHKSWNIKRAQQLMEQEKERHEMKLITEKEELTEEMVNAFAPDFIFFPHWSFYIPGKIYKNWNCIVFHMTDLPFGRGGSPLQNLIVRGYEETKISAIQVVDKLDAGAIYLKEDLSLEGSATEIFERASEIIFTKMMPKILEGNMTPKQQEGEITTFTRRTREDGELLPQMDLKVIYDYIRMLDAEGYPNAFIRFGDYTIDFSDAKFDGENVQAQVKIYKENV